MIDLKDTSDIVFSDGYGKRGKVMDLSPNDIQVIRDNLEQIAAIETLEYHNKNYLAGDNKTRCEARRILLLECLSLLSTTAHDRIG